MTPLPEWQNFYVVVGGAAGALTGLQFVVMALIADMPAQEEDAPVSDAFATPTIVHFVAVLLLSATLVMPWRGLLAPAILWIFAGTGGLIYTGIVSRRMREQNGYEPVIEDWAFHSVLPIVAYGGLAVASALLHSSPQGSMFGIGGALLLLLTVGIHNAWDNVTYLVTLRRKRLKLHGG